MDAFCHLDTYAAAGDRAMIWVWGGLMTLCAAGALAGNVIANRMATRISRVLPEICEGICLKKSPISPPDKRTLLLRHH